MWNLESGILVRLRRIESGAAGNAPDLSDVSLARRPCGGLVRRTCGGLADSPSHRYSLTTLGRCYKNPVQH